MPLTFLIALCSAALSAIICIAVWKRLLPSPHSVPSERSLHIAPITRGGGLGIVAGLLFGWVLLGVDTWILAAVFLLWLISSLDDWMGVAPMWRLGIQTVAAIMITYVCGPTNYSFLLVIAIVWFINLFNFMDGADGIAATTAATGALSLAAFAWLFSTGANGTGPSAITSTSLVVAAAAIGFLIFNLPPARIFMGDGGSTVLGLSLVALSATGVSEKLWSWATPIALFAPFLADATYTLLRRLHKRHSPLQPHREHLYQRLALAGLGHRGVLMWITGWNLLSIIVAYWLHVDHGPFGFAYAVLYAITYVAVTEWTLRKQPNLLMNPRAFLVLIYDVTAAATAWAIVFWARFNFNIDTAEFTAQDVLNSLAFVVPAHAIVFVGLGLYQGLWRFASMGDLRRIVLGAFVGAALTALLLGIIRPSWFIWPRSVLFMYPILLVFLMGGARFAFRSWKEHRLYGLAAAKGDPVLVLGAGAAGARLVSELARSETWHVVALLDDDMAKVGARVHDTPVVGKLDQAKEVAKRFGARHAIIAMPNANHESRRRAASLAAAAELNTLTVPSYNELLSEDSPLAKLRAVELEDLLGRDPVALDTAGLALWFSERTVLVTGAGGSIGTELCNQVARFRPGKLVMVDNSEFASHVMGEHMAERLLRHEFEVYVGDVRDEIRMQEIFQREQPAIVLHAAAYKHVPLTESINAWEAVRNNVLGTLVTARCARNSGVEKFVLISTDKAVRASSIMGASKRLAELAIMSMPVETTRFVCVRFGNVLGSNGSVIPKFREQIAAGKPVTVTHADMTRYFMSIPEAAQLVLQAGLLAQPRSLYVLDMGTPVRIVELAEELIRLTKGAANSVPIVFTGLRPGEKMHEELIGAGEHFTETPHAKVRRVVSDSDERLDLAALETWLKQPPPVEVHASLRQWVKDFNPSGQQEVVRNGHAD